MWSDLNLLKLKVTNNNYTADTFETLVETELLEMNNSDAKATFKTKKQRDSQSQQ